MRFEWDSAKDKENTRKHGISFLTATQAFSDPFSITIEDRVVETEQRLWTIGRLQNQSVVVIVHTDVFKEEEIVRIVSARRATPRERRAYENLI